MATESITGTEIIRLQVDPSINNVTLNCGDLVIEQVSGENVVGFSKGQDKLTVHLDQRQSNITEVTIVYHGAPNRGLIFDKELRHVYTIFSTSHWMVCHDLPIDKAKFHLDLVVPNDKSCIANGELIKKQGKNGRRCNSDLIP